MFHVLEKAVNIKNKTTGINLQTKWHNIYLLNGSLERKTVRQLFL